jgi:hypothetical protein
MGVLLMEREEQPQRGFAALPPSAFCTFPRKRGKEDLAQAVSQLIGLTINRRQSPARTTETPPLASPACGGSCPEG